MITDYLAAERERGRIAAAAEPDALGPTLIGAAHLLFADRTGPAPDAAAVARVVTTVIGGVLREPPRDGGPGTAAPHRLAAEPPASRVSAARKTVGADRHPVS